MKERKQPSWRAEGVRQNAPRDRHNAVALGARNFDHPQWLLASLTEAWATMRHGSLTGRMAVKHFLAADADIAAFLMAVLGEVEVRSIIREHGGAA